MKSLSEETAQKKIEKGGEHWQSLSPKNKASFLKMAIRKKVFPSSAWNRESTQCFSRPVPAKPRPPYSTPSRSQQDHVLFLSCHWAVPVGVWSSDQQHHQGSCSKCKLSVPTLDLWNQETLISSFNKSSKWLQAYVLKWERLCSEQWQVGQGSLVLLDMTPRAMSAPPHFSGPCYRLQYVFQNSSVEVLNSKYNCIWR